MTLMLESSDKEVKATIIKTIQQELTNSPEINEHIENLRK